MALQIIQKERHRASARKPGRREAAHNAQRKSPRVHYHRFICQSPRFISETICCETVSTSLSRSTSRSVTGMERTASPRARLGFEALNCVGGLALAAPSSDAPACPSAGALADPPSPAW